MLSAAKHLSSSKTQMLRCAQHDRRDRPGSKNLLVKGGAGPRPGIEEQQKRGSNPNRVGAGLAPALVSRNNRGIIIWALNAP